MENKQITLTPAEKQVSLLAQSFIIRSRDHLDFSQAYLEAITKKKEVLEEVIDEIAKDTAKDDLDAVNYHISALHLSQEIKQITINLAEAKKRYQANLYKFSQETDKVNENWTQIVQKLKNKGKTIKPHQKYDIESWEAINKQVMSINQEEAMSKDDSDKALITQERKNAWYNQLLMYLNLTK